MKSLFDSLLKSDAAAGLILLLCALAAIILANTSAATFYNGLVAHPWWINDGLMAIFFFYVGLEIKREWREGFLNKPAQRWLPVIAALGGMLAPALLYVLFNYNNPESLAGWAIPTATDIAFAVGIYALVGKRLPASLKIFLLALAVMDDLGAVIIIALFYTGGLDGQALAGAACFIAGLWLLNRLHVHVAFWYIMCAVGLWLCMLQSGVHATIAGVVASMFIPMTGVGRKPSLLKQFEHSLKPLVAFFIMPLFAFANAGVSLSGVSLEILWHPITLGIMAGLFIGKQIGIFGTTWVLVKAGICAMPVGCTWRHIWGMSLLAGIGFTMSLFIATLAFTSHSAYMVEVKVGIMAASILAAGLGLLVLRNAPPAAANPATRRPQHRG